MFDFIEQEVQSYFFFRFSQSKARNFEEGQIFTEVVNILKIAVGEEVENGKHPLPIDLNFFEVGGQLSFKIIEYLFH